MVLALEILPFVALGGTAILLAASWESIPDRFPIHWGLDGMPNGWASRSAVGVFGPLLLGALLCVLVLVVRAIGSRKLLRQGIPRGGAVPSTAFQDSNRRFVRHLLLATEYVLSVTFCATGLLPFLGRPGPVLVVALGSAGLLVAYAIAGAVRLARAYPRHTGVSDHWKWGLFYVNHADPSLFVPKRIGLGWTLNFGRRGAWLVLALLLGAPLAVAVTLALLM